MKITREQLVAWRACADELEVFDDVFPTSEVEVTRENLNRALTAGLSLWWFGDVAFGACYHRLMVAPPRRDEVYAINGPDLLIKLAEVRDAFHNAHIDVILTLAQEYDAGKITLGEARS